MDSEQFRSAAKQLADYIADYQEGIRDRPVLPNVQPGYIDTLVPAEAPEEGEPWTNLYNDIENVVMRGMTHWNSPRFSAYFPTANSYPAICGDMLSTALSCIGFSWNAAPACTELEMKMMDWLVNMLGLPEHFCFTSGKGGGVIQGTASESTLIAMLCARRQVLKERGFDQKVTDNDDNDEQEMEKYRIMSRLVAYTSTQSHSSVEKAALLSSTRIRMIPTDADLAMDGPALSAQIEADKKKGLIPFIVIGTLGTTNTCAFDNLRSIGQICDAENIWLHVDAAYAGSAFICPEYREYLDGVEYATSFTMNPHKWLLVNFDCNALWVKEKALIEDAFNVHPVYLKHENEGKIADYRHWQIPLGRRFRSLKMWFVFRSYGIKGLQSHIRKQIGLAHLFGQLLKDDNRFEIVDKIRMGLVCFRLKGSNDLNERLIGSINASRLIFLTPTKVSEKFIIRFAVCSRNCNEQDIRYSWKVIREHAESLLLESGK